MLPLGQSTGLVERHRAHLGQHFQRGRVAQRNTLLGGLAAARQACQRHSQTHGAGAGHHQHRERAHARLVPPHAHQPGNGQSHCRQHQRGGAQPGGKPFGQGVQLAFLRLKATHLVTQFVHSPLARRGGHGQFQRAALPTAAHKTTACIHWLPGTHEARLAFTGQRGGVQPAVGLQAAIQRHHVAWGNGNALAQRDLLDGSFLNLPLMQHLHRRIGQRQRIEGFQASLTTQRFDQSPHQ